MSLYIDLTEVLATARRTGIERISGEICRHLPANTAIPVRFDLDRYLALPRALIGAIGRYFSDTDVSEVAKIREMAGENGRVVSISNDDTVLVPEIFGEDRAGFFRRMPDQQFERCRFIVYDLLPFTHPEYFPADLPLIMAGYFQTIRRSGSCGFISEETREAYFRRLKRTAIRDGVILPLGSDSLTSRVSTPSLSRPLAFTMLGTIEPRKHHSLILEAFEPLLRQIDGLSLSFIGSMGWVDSEVAQKVKALAAASDSGFRFYPAPDDGTIRTHIERSRATIYVSAAEGYGLPPVESLWAGTPVIASTTIPSLQRLGSAGIHYVEPLNVVNLRRAVLAFLDDAYVARKIEETTQLNLPTWRLFTEEVLHWCARN